MHIFRLALTVALCLAIGGEALAYGTVRFLGQDAEHERITRRALSCGPNVAASDCFEAETLDKLAGKNRTFGGVGYPDNPTKKLTGQASAHCDGGDFLDVPEYGRDKRGNNRTLEEANAAIMECRDWMAEHFTAALSVAADMLDANGDLIDEQIDISGKCIKNLKRKNTAKCNALTHIGIVLHAVQDFYSHSNWTDIADAEAPTGPENPPGLGYDGPAGFLTMPDNGAAFPGGLITGCYEGVIESRNCRYKDASGERHDRVKHSYLNKDKGNVDPPPGDNATDFPGVGLIGPGKAGRGAVNKNFERSVSAAILDTRAKLAEFKNALALTHGEDKAALLYCALAKDAPLRDCAN